MDWWIRQMQELTIKISELVFPAMFGRSFVFLLFSRDKTKMLTCSC